ncbi:MAG: FHA domain-containing protein [Bacteriovoracaceae bacterium]
MRLEIHNENGRKEIVNVTKDKVVVGSGENSDIIILGQHIARNQLILEKIGGKIFITDLDNPNGTYINDTLLEPHKKVEFLSFFPLQIGPKILIYLLADEDEAPIEVYSSKEKVPVKESNNSQISDDINSLLAGSEKRTSTKKAAPKVTPTPSVANQKKMTRVKKSATNIYIGLTIAALGLSYYFYKLKSEDGLSETAHLSAVDPYIAIQKEIKEERDRDYKSLLTEKKCEEKVDLTICHLLKIPFAKDEGVITQGNTAYLVFNMDRAQVTSVQEELTEIPVTYRNLYLILRILANQNMWVEMEKEGITKFHLVNLQSIQGKTIIQSELKIDQQTLLSHITFDDMNTIIYSLRHRKNLELLDKVDIEILKLTELKK